ncbi:lytic transglycosylase domain-containing protein [Phenylobacterium hankyongense]|uniref:Lytic transglycosylase domain-containing protein n=1 Tax=Phenylobacterium hankyongense TaxID=1813876 RepID=A0A328B2E6_9CAUL|nr:transglycosylase SLT domain-containing protein [Phenylobacterium hankyongense]RAK61622.1 lytic transglycosylase domain-containing protein [Phenylobacterium hankyongense]
MAIEGIRGVVEAAIQRASQATGVDFSFLMKTAGRESGMNPGAKAGTSSAAGLFQFVEQTWLSTLKQHGSKYGYARYAELISKGGDGRYHVTGDEARKAVMDLRLDPHAASLMAGELASDHAAYLKGRVGRPPTAGELYAAHFLGPQGSAKLIEAVQASPAATAAHLFPDAARANKSIFYRDGRAASVAEVYANLTKTAGAGAPVESADVPANDDGAFIQYASARRADRMREQDALVSMILRGSQPADQAGVGSRLAGSLFTTEMLRLLSDSRSES